MALYSFTMFLFPSGFCYRRRLQCEQLVILVCIDIMSAFFIVIPNASLVGNSGSICSVN